MKKYTKFLIYLSLFLTISLTILVINYINSSYTPEIVDDINSGVISVILTTFITLLLLSNQSESEEILTKKSVVYEEKLKVFNVFINTIGQCLEDGNLTLEDTRKIIHSFSLLRIHISPENVIRLENSISTIDDSFFYCDENSIPDLFKLSKLYTEISIVLRLELYGKDDAVNLKIFDYENLRKVHYRKRDYKIILPTFDDFITELQKYSKIYSKSTKTGLTIVYDLTPSIIEAIRTFHDFIVTIVDELEKDLSLHSLNLNPNHTDLGLITFAFELKTCGINTEIFSRTPLVRLYAKGHYFAWFGLTEMKKLSVYSMIPKQEGIATLEIYEIDSRDKYKLTVLKGLRKAIKSIDPKTLFDSEIG